MAHHPDPRCCLVLVSPDDSLKLLVTKEDGDLSVGFEGYSWHTHADVLLAEYKTDMEEEALGRFIEDVITGRRQIVILKKAGVVADAWIDYRPDSPLYRHPGNDPYLEPDERIEIRPWLS